MSSSYVHRETPAKNRTQPGRFSDRYYIARVLREEIQATVESVMADRPAAVVVDFGCADLPYRSFFPQTCTYIGVDLPGNPHASAKLLPEGRADLPDAAADVVLSTQVLEHVPDPAGYLRECHRLLKPGGTLILSTHGHWMYHPDPNDYWRWTTQGLRRILTDAGLQVERISGVLGLAATGAQLFQDGWKPRLPWLIKTPFVGLMQVVIQLSDRLLNRDGANADAAVFMTLSRKPLE